MHLQLLVHPRWPTSDLPQGLRQPSLRMITEELRHSLISAGPKVEIAAPYFDPDLICRKSGLPGQE